MTRILLIEDEISFSDPLSYLLAKEGYEVAVAETGPDGLAQFEADGADLELGADDYVTKPYSSRELRPGPGGR